MQLTSIGLARIAAFLEVHSWDPFGKTVGLEAFARVGERYSFQIVPKQFADIDLQKGIELSAGKFGTINIDKITVYFNGIMIDTRSSTDDCEKILDDILELTNKAFGTVISPQRRFYVSQLVFKSGLSLMKVHSIFQGLSSVISDQVSRDMKHDYRYEPNSIQINADLSQTKIAPGAFTIERRTDVPFDENTYFSNAPLRTKNHIELLEHLEKALLS